MVGLDTNVIVRVLVGDDPAQTKKAERAFVEHCHGDGVYLSLIVLTETAWVLAQGYGWQRAMIYDRVQRLVRTRGVFVDDTEMVSKALESYAHGKADLADYLVLGQSEARGALPLLTFDRTLGRVQGAKLL